MYATIEDVRTMIKDDAINTIIGDKYIEDEDEREDKVIPIIKSAIEDAEGEIDGYLCKRYPTPLQVIPKIINKICKDIAAYNIFSRLGIDEGERENNYLTRYKSAIKYLEMVAVGKVDIDASASSGVTNTGFKVNSSMRLFSRQSMRGM